MTTKLSRERVQTRALHHLHTSAAELAGFASKVVVDAATATRVGATTSGVDVGPSSSKTSSSKTSSKKVSSERLPGLRALRLRRRDRISNLTRIGAALGAMLFAGSAALVVGPTTPTGPTPNSPTPNSPTPNSPTPNSVVAFGSAPVLGSGVGLELHAGVIAIAGDPSAPGYWLVGSDGGIFAFGKAKFFGSTGAATLNSPIVGIAATPTGSGYWLVGSDGGVFAFGDAGFYGSMAKTRLAAPIASIVSTHDGNGYWLVGSDGGIFAFGDAKFHGSAKRLHLARPIVAAVATTSGRGYWLLGSDGGVFSFGDARFAGSAPNASHPAVGIASSPDGHGYWIAHSDGSVTGFHVTPVGNDALFDTAAGQAPTVGIAAGSAGGYWIAQGAATKTSSLADDPFLACTRAHESNSAGGYGAVSSGGTYRGAYQFDRSTWNSAARLAGRNDLVGVDPATASPADQDLLALDLFHARGPQPWGGRCANLT